MISPPKYLRLKRPSPTHKSHFIFNLLLGICDIGSATFNYDMRRLNEILDFPKAWYKRGLVQRLFLGKEGSYATKTSAVGSDQVHGDTTPTRPTNDDMKRR